MNFGEAVTDFVTGDITVTGGTKSNFTGASGASSYTVTVAPTGNADITVSVAAAAADDLAGNASLAAADTLTVAYSEDLALSGARGPALGGGRESAQREPAGGDGRLAGPTATR